MAASGSWHNPESRAPFGLVVELTKEEGVLCQGRQSRQEPWRSRGPCCRPVSPPGRNHGSVMCERQLSAGVTCLYQHFATNLP